MKIIKIGENADCLHGEVIIADHITDECESCGHVEINAPLWCDGGTWRCLDCAQYSHEYDLTQTELDLIEEEVNKRKNAVKNS